MRKKNRGRIWFKNVLKWFNLGKPMKRKEWTAISRFSTFSKAASFIAFVSETEKKVKLQNQLLKAENSPSFRFQFSLEDKLQRTLYSFTTPFLSYCLFINSPRCDLFQIFGYKREILILMKCSAILYVIFFQSNLLFWTRNRTSQYWERKLVPKKKTVEFSSPACAFYCSFLL